MTNKWKQAGEIQAEPATYISYGTQDGVTALFNKASRCMVFQWERSPDLAPNFLNPDDRDKFSQKSIFVDLVEKVDFLKNNSDFAHIIYQSNPTMMNGTGMSDHDIIPAKPRWVAGVIQAAKLNR